MLKQIEYTKYEEDLEDDGVENILKYGMACYKKRCRVMLAENRLIRIIKNTDNGSGYKNY